MTVKIKLGADRRWRAFFILGILLLSISALYTLRVEDSSERLKINLTANTEASENFPSELEYIYEEFLKLLPDGISADTDSLAEAFSIESIISGVLKLLEEGGGAFGEVASGLLGAVLILAASDIFLESHGDLSAAAVAGINTVTAIPIFSSLYGLISEVNEGLCSASELFGGVIPLAGSLLSASGFTATAAAQATGMSLTLGLVSTVISRILLPLVSAVFVLTAALAINGGAPCAVGGIKSLFTFVMGAATTAIAGALTLQTVITSAQDSLTMRGMKYAVSNMIPAVGSVVSGSLSTLHTGVCYLSGIMGGASVLAILSVFAIPLVELLFCRLALKFGVSMLEFLGGAHGKGTLLSFVCAIDMLISVAVCSSLIYLLEIMLFMKLGVG